MLATMTYISFPQECPPRCRRESFRNSSMCESRCTVSSFVFLHNLNPSSSLALRRSLCTCQNYFFDNFELTGSSCPPACTSAGAGVQAQAVKVLRDGGPATRHSVRTCSRADLPVLTKVDRPGVILAVVRVGTDRLHAQLLAFVKDILGKRPGNNAFGKWAPRRVHACMSETHKIDLSILLPVVAGLVRT